MLVCRVIIEYKIIIPNPKITHLALYVKWVIIVLSNEREVINMNDYKTVVKEMIDNMDEEYARLLFVFWTE